MANSLPRKTHATAADVAAYQAHIATPAFRAYMDEQEAAIRARGPRVTQ
jgi:quinol monooxygenase YgiN